ncbi:MAG: hypothetical protein LBV18_06020 [Alistipes sp.]|jgi:hypothetical protein|nr:hypothetical protein [Alistipes sp.]
MKKLILFMLAAATLCSCDGDRKKNNDSESQEPEKTETATVAYSVVGGRDMVSLVEITAVYVDASGSEVRETVDALPWTKTITGAQLPFEAKIGLECVKKSARPEQTSYQIGLNNNIAYSVGEGERIDLGYVSSTMTVGADKVDDALDHIFGRLEVRSVQIDPAK